MDTKPDYTKFNKKDPACWVALLLVLLLVVLIPVCTYLGGH